MIWDEINDYIDDKRIVFAYIPYYRCLYDVNLNFDTEFSIEYDKVSKHLSIRRNDTFPKDFWPGNISSVSVIAGKNGAGKSSVIQWLMERTFFGGMPTRSSYFYLLDDFANPAGEKRKIFFIVWTKCFNSVRG